MKQQYFIFLFVLFISFLQISSLMISSKLKSNAKRNHKNKQNNKKILQIKYDQSLGYKVLKKIPRDLSRLYYTQGFKFFDKDTIVESSGLYGESVIHFIDSKTFQVKKELSLSKEYFGEGCAVFTKADGQKEIHQMTYQERKIFVYDANTLQKVKEFDMPDDMEEGWGLCTKKRKNTNGQDEDIFLATDGSNNLFEIDPQSWSVLSKTPILDGKGNQIIDLNDLEIIQNNIFVNLYIPPIIVQLDENYKFKRAYNFEQLRKEVFESDIFKKNGFQDDEEYCLNGIAYDQATNRIQITGKKWPYVYEIEFDNLN